MKLLQTLVILAFCATSIGIHAQDAYFSNFFYSNSQTNPAQAAISEDINLRLIHRSQWMSLVKPFTTSQFEGSFPLRKAVTGEKYGVIGVSFVNDRLGDGGYLSTNQFGLSFAYNLQLRGTSHLAFGLKGGYFNGATSTDNITTGSMWNGASFDPQAGIGEDLSNPVLKGVELTPGVMWYQLDTIHQYQYYFGISGHNVFPTETGMLVEGFNLPTRFTVTGGADLMLANNKFSIAPKALFMIQGNQNQAVLGTDWVYHLSYNKNKRSAVALATYYRMSDAVIAGAKYLSTSFDVGVTYDLTTSTITDGLNTGTGSLEMFLNYKIPSRKDPIPYLYTLEVYDETQELTPANAVYKSITTGEKGTLLTNQSKGAADLHVKEEYEITINKEGYIPQTIQVKNLQEEDMTQKVYLEPKVKKFDLDMQVFDKESNDPVRAKVYRVDENGNETLVGEGEQLNTPLEIGKDHKLIVRADGYDDKEIDVSYDKYGTLNKPVYLDKSFTGAYLSLKVVDEDTKKELPATVMVSDITVPTTPINSLMVMNDVTPDQYPLEMNRKFEILITKEGYFNKSIKLEVNSAEPISRTVELSALGVGKSIVLDDLLFKTGKAELDERSYRLLDQLVEFMNQNPTLKIEIGGHTDNVGSNSSNQRLSEARAQSAVDYIVAKGISRVRLKAKGYGEDTPIADNDTDNGRAKNRRVELKVIGK